MIALQLFAREFKQADLTLTGTARKANLVDQSTRIVPQPAPTQAGRRASAITSQTPTSARGRPSIAGLPAKEESRESTPKPERKCVRCKVEASPRWWKTEVSAPTNQSTPPVVDGPLLPNGVNTNGRATDESNPPSENGYVVNGSINQVMTDASPVPTEPRPRTLGIDTEAAVVRPDTYLCQKCHWKRQNGAEEEEEEERLTPVHTEPHQLPLRSPAVQPFVPPQPPTMAGSWDIPGVASSMAPNQAPPLPSWHNGIPPPGPGQPPHPLHSGLVHPQQPHPAAMSQSLQFHAPYPHPKGYPPYSGPPIHTQMLTARMRGSYPSVTGPMPLNLNNGAMIINGMHSPHGMPYSPTHPHGHPPSRSTESPYTHAQYTTLHNGSPAPGPPATPRDTMMQDAPAVTAAPTERATTGASASPSLRNLLH